MPGELFILHGCNYPKCDAVVDKRFSDYCSLQLMTEGGIYLSYGNRRQELRTPTAWVCYPGSHIRFGRLPEYPWWCHWYIAFRGPLVSQWQEHRLLPFDPQPVPHPAPYVEMFRSMLELANRGDAFGRLRAVNLIEAILLRLADERRQALDPWVEQVHALLERHHGHWPDYQKIAAEMGMGLSTLRRHYRRQTGNSLHGACIERRIATARNLLTGTSLPIKRIARELGYNDIYFFSRQFRQITGVAPGLYRRSRQG